MVGCVGSEWALRNQRKQSRVPLYGLSAFRESRLLFRYSLPSYFTGFIYPAVTWLTSAILVHQPLGYAEMGVFNAVNQWRSAILFLPTALGMPILTVLSNILGVGDVDRYRRAFILSMVATTLIALFPALLICIMSSIILAAYGPAFAGGSLVLVLLAITAVLNAPCSVIGSAFSSSGDMWTVAELNAIWAVVLVAIFFLFTKDLGALGMALAFVIAHVVHLVNSVVFYIRKDRHSVVLQTAHRGHELG
jgi:O-antigen/teichoic acid export membrane protein